MNENNTNEVEIVLYEYMPTDYKKIIPLFKAIIDYTYTNKWSTFKNDEDWVGWDDIVGKIFDLNIMEVRFLAMYLDEILLEHFNELDDDIEDLKDPLNGDPNPISLSFLIASTRIQNFLLDVVSKVEKQDLNNELKEAAVHTLLHSNYLVSELIYFSESDPQELSNLQIFAVNDARGILAEYEKIEDDEYYD